jgi:hypothetical protein
VRAVRLLGGASRPSARTSHIGPTNFANGVLRHHLSVAVACEPLRRTRIVRINGFRWQFEPRGATNGCEPPGWTMSHSEAQGLNLASIDPLHKRARKRARTSSPSASAAVTGLIG